MRDLENTQFFKVETEPETGVKLVLSTVYEALKERYHCLVGYSGHEQNIEPTVAAVTLGAKVIERHVTVDHELWGTDQKASLEIGAMSMVYRRCCGVFEAIGNGTKTLDEDERTVREKLRGK